MQDEPENYICEGQHQNPLFLRDVQAGKIQVLEETLNFDFRFLGRWKDFLRTDFHDL